MSWQDLVKSDGAVVDSRRQFPLLYVSDMFKMCGVENVPHVAVGEVPPPNRFRMID